MKSSQVKSSRPRTVRAKYLRYSKLELISPYRQRPQPHRTVTCGSDPAQVEEEVELRIQYARDIARRRARSYVEVERRAAWLHARGPPRTLSSQGASAASEVCRWWVALAVGENSRTRTRVIRDPEIRQRH